MDSTPESETAAYLSTEESSDLGIVDDDTQHYGDERLISAPGVETVCVFPKNSGKGTEYCFISYYSLNFSSLLY